MSTPQFGLAICDPGPCDPGPLTVVMQDMGFAPLILLAATAFVTGRVISRRSILLSSLGAAAIGTAFYVSFAWKTRLVWQALAGGTHPISDSAWNRLWQHEVWNYAVGLLVWAIIPLGAGLAWAAIRRRRASAHVQGSVG